jgi:hypothetical protein
VIGNNCYIGFGVPRGRSGTLGGVDSSVSWMRGRWMIGILVGPVLEQEGAGGGRALGVEEAPLVEETCTQGLYTCSLMAEEVVKITCRGPVQGGCKARGGIGPL